jgi:ABC-type transporter Mla subunit MlaD
MVDKLRIESDGTTMGTKVTYRGLTLDNVVKIEIDPIEPHSYIRAHITFNQVELALDVDAEELKTKRWTFG